MGKSLPFSYRLYFPLGHYQMLLYIRVVVILLLICFLFSQTVFSATIISQNNGFWSFPNTWTGGFVPLEQDDAVIDSEVTIAEGTVVEINSLTITQNGKLHIYGSLIIRQNLEMENNGSELITGTGASILIFGNAQLDNRVTLDLSSFFIVLGDFLRIGSDNQGTLSINGAQIYVFGTVSSSWDDFTGCLPGNYDGTTLTVGDDCDAGQFDDFIVNIDPEELPDGIFQRIVDCNPVPTAVLSGDAELCDDGSTTTLTIVLSGTAPWKITILRDGENPVNVNEIFVNPYAFQVSEAGTYTLHSVSDVKCTGTVSGSAAVLVKPLPLTSEIKTN